MPLNQSSLVLGDINIVNIIIFVRLNIYDFVYGGGLFERGLFKREDLFDALQNC